MPEPPCLDSKRTRKEQKEKLSRLIEIRDSMLPQDPSYAHAEAQVSAQEQAVVRAEEIYWDCYNSHQ